NCGINPFSICDCRISIFDRQSQIESRKSKVDMNLLWRALEWFSRVLLPVRLRPSVMQQQLQQALDRTVTEAEKGAVKVGKTAERIEGAEPPKTGKAAVVARWVFHFLIIGLVMVGLFFLNRWLQLERVLRSEMPFLHAFWLPLLFLLL